MSKDYYRGDAAHDHFLHDAEYHYRMCFDSDCTPTTVTDGEVAWTRFGEVPATPARGERKS